MTDILSPGDFAAPAIHLAGAVDYQMYQSFRDQLGRAPGEGLVVVELSTLGGDPEVARMIGEDIRFHSDVALARRFVFLGKAAIYSAGTTLMSFFSRPNRYLTRGTRLLVHERQLTRTINLEGPLSSLLPVLEGAVAEIRASIAIQEEGFASLVRGASISLDEVVERARSNWYVEAQEAKALGLVEDVI